MISEGLDHQWSSSSGPSSMCLFPPLTMCGMSVCAEAHDPCLCLLSGVVLQTLTHGEDASMSPQKIVSLPKAEPWKFCPF